MSNEQCAMSNVPSDQRCTGGRLSKCPNSSGRQDVCPTFSDALLEGVSRFSLVCWEGWKLDRPGRNERGERGQRATLDVQRWTLDVRRSTFNVTIDPDVCYQLT